MAWDYDKIAYDKQAAFDPVWHLTRQIRYGLKDGERINRKNAEANLPRIRIPDNQRAFLELLLWNKKF